MLSFCRKRKHRCFTESNLYSCIQGRLASNTVPPAREIKNSRAPARFEPMATKNPLFSEQRRKSKC